VIGHAVRPLDTEDTGVLDPGVVEVETSLDLARNHDDNVFGSRLVVSVGTLPRLEARVETAVEAFDRPGVVGAGVGDSLVGLKYRALDESVQAPAVLLAAAVRLPTGDEDRGLGAGDTAVIALAALSKTWGAFTVTANAGYAFSVAGRTADVVMGSVAAERHLASSWSLLGEVVALVGMGDQRDRVIARLGLAWQASTRVRLDGAVATGLSHGSEDLIATVGATLRF
jgi:hypothetical protein